MVTLLILVSSLVASLGPSYAGDLKVSYLYNLASESGTLETTGVTLALDRETGDLFVLGYGVIRVYDGNGMETFVMGDDSAVPALSSIAPLPGGDILGLTWEGKLLRLNFRGELIGEVETKGVPEDYRPPRFMPNKLAFAGGKAYLVDRTGMRMLVLDASTGEYLASRDLAEALEVAKLKEELRIDGFWAGDDGTLLLTIGSIFRAYVVSPDGTFLQFGKSGSAPGQFGVVAGIARDKQGRIFVVDSLKSAVMVFDGDLKFIGEFGGRGRAPGRMTAPRDIAVGDGKVWVSQYGDRGVSVYAVP